MQHELAGPLKKQEGFNFILNVYLAISSKEVLGYSYKIDMPPKELFRYFSKFMFAYARKV